jgi:hypothetical protein
MKILNRLLQLPYPTTLLLLGVVVFLLPFISFDGSWKPSAHAAATYIPVWTGTAFMFSSLAIFTWEKIAGMKLGDGLDLSHVTEADGVYATTVNGCEIRVVLGRIEHHIEGPIALPCNEFFDDHCAADPHGALGAYVDAVFRNRLGEFNKLVAEQCAKQFTTGMEMAKTSTERAISYGDGHCLLIERPLDHATPVALVSTSRQRPSEGISARISALFNGMRELFEKFADATLQEVTMPVFGGGRGGIDPSMALVGLLLAVAEAARNGQGGQKLKRATIVVFRRDENSLPQVDIVVIKRALGLISAR